MCGFQVRNWTVETVWFAVDIELARESLCRFAVSSRVRER
jgi:hypothetical protein